ncbi:hypothetical protein [Emcibacter nanhaiensis]|uniref:Uncharacterized protein n=1 Tax=Emcibacter nanhaiensis TaxID=1505037 RepID=A0A501PBK8_9PROT|nr:hypothetical protein [Emcibacter nanhaiensis]TPD57366.1 hypothetical protein FIV46_14670 [Emcibacter nanhaiensis]
MIDATSSALGASPAESTGRNGNSFVVETKEKKASFEPMVEQFLKWARMTPAERLRAQYLKDNGLTEESLAALPPEKQKAIEQEIKDLIEDKLQVGDDTKEELERMEQARFGKQALDNLLAMQSMQLANQAADSD